MSDDFIDRLRAVDPASSEQPDLSAIKAKVDAHTADNIVPFTSKRSQYGRGLRIAAAVGALALAGGAGFAGGSWRAGGGAQESPSASTITSQDRAISPGLAPTGTPGVGGGVATDSKVAGYGGMGGAYWGSAILKPAEQVSNTAGSATAYRFSADGIDALALAKSLARALGIDVGKVAKQGDGSVQANDDRGAYNVYVGNDALMWFNGYSQERSPWSCDVVDGSTGKEQTAAEAQALQEKCNSEWPTPSKADAVAAAKQLVATLGLDLADGARYSAYSYSPRLMTVVVTPIVDGMAIGSTWQVEVAKDGAFSVSGYAAKPVKAVAYPTVGARDAALRSELRKWQAFGPQQLFDPNTVYTSSEEAQPQATPTVATKDGKPVLQGYISEVPVFGATRGLMQVYLADGTSMLMPAWDFTASDGSRWQMLAITEDYIDWTSQPTGGPVAYAADGARSSVGSATASAGTAAPLLK